MENRHETHSSDSSVENIRMLIEMNGPQEFLDRGMEKILERESLSSLMHAVAEVIVDDLHGKSTNYIDNALSEFRDSFAFGYQTLPTSDEVADEAVNSLKDDIEQLITDSNDDLAERLGSTLRTGWIKFNGGSRLISSYIEHYEPSPLHTNYVYMGFGLAAEINCRRDQLQRERDMVENLLPEIDYSGDLDSPKMKSQDEMDKQLWELTDKERPKLSQQQTLREWTNHILNDGTLNSIYKELHRALHDIDLAKNDDEEVMIGELILDGMAYGLDLGSHRWDTGIIGKDSLETIRIRMDDSDAFEEVGMLLNPEDRWNHYTNIASGVYDKFYGDIYEEVVTYADENIYEDDYRDIFTISAGIMIGMYNKASILKQYKQELYMKSDRSLIDELEQRDE